MIDVSAGMIRFGSPRDLDDMHHYGVLSFADVIVKSSNVGAIKVGLKLGTERLSHYVSRFGFGQAGSPDFRGENPGIVWNPAKLDPSALASVSMGYQVGVTPLQMATRGQLGRQRRHAARAARRARRRSGTAGAPRWRRKALRRTIVTERTAGQLTAIMEAVVERGTAQGRADPRLHDRRQDRHRAASSSTAATRSPTTTRRSSASCRRASRRSTIIVVIDSPHGKGVHRRRRGGANLQAHCRSVAAPSRYCPDTSNAPPPVLVARHESRAGRPPTRARRRRRSSDQADRTRATTD